MIWEIGFFINWLMEWMYCVVLSLLEGLRIFFVNPDSQL